MMELAGIFTGALVVALSGALMPGPLLTVTVADSARRGFMTGPLLMTGHAILELALVLGVIFGLGPILEKPTVMGAVALLGGLILLWMGAGMIRSAPRMSLTLDAEGAGALRNPVLTGILASLSNPYWTLWWATVGLGYLVASMKYGAAGVAVFFVGHISADFLWYSIVSLAVSRGRNIMTDAVYRNVLRVCGVVLLGFGGWFLATAGKIFI